MNTQFCNHIRTEVYKDGDLICTDCGLVLLQRNLFEESIETFNDVIWFYGTLRKFIQEVCSRLNICDSVMNDAMYYFYKVANDCETKHHMNEKCMAALLISCRSNNVAITPEEISYSSGKDKNLITRLSEEMCEKLYLVSEQPPAVCFLEKYCYNLNLKFEVERHARGIIERAYQNKPFVVQNNHHIAAVAVYISSNFYGKEISKDRIKQVCPMCTSTFNKIYKILNKF